jgi:predicted permease
VRLVFSSIIAWLIAPLMGLNGLSRQVGILEAAMPTAVLNLVITQKYNLEPEFVSKTILLSTLFSSVTLSILLVLVSL